MNVSNINPEWKIEKIEWCTLPGKRPRVDGCNARLGFHGDQAPLDMARITIGGRTGFGWSRISKEKAQQLMGTAVRDLFTPEGKVNSQYYAIEFALLDWLGKMVKKPVYELFIQKNNKDSFSVPCYYTSLYFDDLHLDSDEKAVQFMKQKVLQGWDQGHRSFKIKVGRGAMHMPVQEGTKRDIAIINGIREAVGPDAKIMIDANNGYTLNLAKEVLTATSEANLYWIEEPFHEDPILLKELKQWLEEQNMKILITDGEGLSAPAIVEWAEEGLLDAIQYDIRSYGFHRWLELGARLDKANVKSAPHNYGGSYGNYALCHLAPAIKEFLFIEWDHADVTGLDTSSYKISNGSVQIPSSPGFGLRLNENVFSNLVETEGWSLQMASHQS